MEPDEAALDYVRARDQGRPWQVVGADPAPQACRAAYDLGARADGDGAARCAWRRCRCAGRGPAIDQASIGSCAGSRLDDLRAAAASCAGAASRRVHALRHARQPQRLCRGRARRPAGDPGRGRRRHPRAGLHHLLGLPGRAERQRGLDLHPAVQLLRAATAPQRAGLPRRPACRRGLRRRRRDRRPAPDAGGRATNRPGPRLGVRRRCLRRRRHHRLRRVRDGFGKEFDEDELRAMCFPRLRPEFPDQVRPGDIVVAGRNFAHHNHVEVSVAIRASGIAVVVVESCEATFIRRALNTGLPIMTCPGIAAAVKDGEIIAADPATGAVTLPVGPRAAGEALLRPHGADLAGRRRHPAAGTRIRGTPRRHDRRKRHDHPPRRAGGRRRARPALRRPRPGLPRPARSA